jgi:integrase
VSKTVSPAQPVADSSFYEALRGIAPHLNPKFALALDLAYSTGHRIDAILKLRWSDINLTSTDEAPFGMIRWRGENDKIENEHVVPMNRLAHESLAGVSRDCPGIGETWVFPSDGDASRPVDRHLASRWLRRAEKLAGVQHSKGRGWHSFRRAWASARKHLPDVDVAAAGGWKDTATMKRCYQQADAAGVLRAVTDSLLRASS